jgi:hypothetical protein
MISTSSNPSSLSGCSTLVLLGGSGCLGCGSNTDGARSCAGAKIDERRAGGFSGGGATGARSARGGTSARGAAAFGVLVGGGLDCSAG